MPYYSILGLSYTSWESTFLRGDDGIDTVASTTTMMSTSSIDYWYSAGILPVSRSAPIYPLQTAPPHRLTSLACGHANHGIGAVPTRVTTAAGRVMI
jgi:hypothetical protein